MAKKKVTSKAADPAPAPAGYDVLDIELSMTTTDLHADPDNPRKISDQAKKGLRASLKHFGDLSGIVWNTRTETTISGHQRMEQIIAEYGQRDVKPVPGIPGLGVIYVDADHIFPVRTVDWSEAKQRSANVVANSQKISGKFDRDKLSDFMLPIADIMQQEVPGLMDDVLLTDLLASELAIEADGDEFADQAMVHTFEVIVVCNGEEHQSEVYEKLKSEGYAIKLVTV